MLPLLLVAACDGDPAALPNDALAFPPVLEVSGLGPGQPGTFTVSDIPPGLRVVVAVSAAGPGQGPCDPGGSGVCLGLQGPLRFIPTRRVGDAYVATPTLPAGLTGPRWFQGLVISGGVPMVTQVVERVVGDGDLDGFPAGPDDCDDGDPSVSIGAGEICGDGIDQDCDGLVDNHCTPWERNGGTWSITQASGYFTAEDCHPSPFPTAHPTVDGVTHNVYESPASGRILGVPGGTSVDARQPRVAWSEAYMLMTGGRCTDEAVSVTWRFSDGTTAGSSLVVPHDCTGSPVYDAVSAGGDFQGFHDAGFCCTGWYSLVFTNPRPARAVDGIDVDYADGCGGAYPGQIWALGASDF